MGRTTAISEASDLGAGRLVGPLTGVALLLAATVLLVALATGIGSLGRGDASHSATDVGAAISIVSQRDLRFLDRADGGIDVRDASTNSLVIVLAPDTNGFVRGVLRALARERILHGVGREAPFRLQQHADGLITITDLAIGTVVTANGFGQTNAASFARLATIKGAAP